MMSVTATKCLTCDAEVEVDQQTVTGEIVECQECGQEHEFQWINEQPNLVFAPEVEEDWGE